MYSNPLMPVVNLRQILALVCCILHGDVCMTIVNFKQPALEQILTVKE